MTDKRRKIKIVLIALAVLIILPVGWYYAIGPRDISDSAEMSQLKVYYMGHEYHCVGWKLGPHVDVKVDKCLRYGLFGCYYLATDKDYIIRTEFQQRLVFKRQDKIQTENSYKQPEEDAVSKAEIHGYAADSYIEFNGDRYVYLFESDFDKDEIQYSVYSNFGIVSGEEMSGHFSRIKCDYDMDFLVLSRVYDGGGNVVYTRLDLTYNELMDILYDKNDFGFDGQQLSKIRNVFQLAEEETSFRNREMFICSYTV